MGANTPPRPKMEEAAKQFARRILIIHLALLTGVIGVVFFASREVYTSTQEQALRQAEQRQSLLAGQTSKGIEAFYRSILNDVDLLRQAPEDEDDVPTTEPSTVPSTSPTTRPAQAKPADLSQFFRTLMGDSPGPGGVTGRLFANILWKQLDGRVSHLFRVDRDRLFPPPKPRPGERESRDPRERVPVIVELSPRDSSGIGARDIVVGSLEWLKQVDKPTIGPFHEYETPEGSKVGMNLVAVPTPEKKRLIVAAVPIKYAQKRFIEELNRDGDSTNALLVDETGTIMVGTNPQLTGRQLSTLKDPDIVRIATAYAARPEKAIERINRRYILGGQEFPPGLVAIEPVSVAGKKWKLMVITPLSDVDAMVNRVFKRALFWAVFVVCAMMAILFSTAIQLIRARVRMERVRADVLTRELTQAREIQLAWLPRHGLSVPTIDIAAVNQPASHISGDFYNWFELPDGRTVVTIGDVTGHGLSAAFLMATTQLLVHTTMLRIQDPGQTLSEVNKQLCMQVFNGQFVTMLVVVIDQQAGLLEVATAGHFPPVLGENGEYVSLKVEPQLVLGVDKDMRYPTQAFDLPASASLVLYTDGVIDVRSPEGKRFALASLMEAIKGQNDSAQGLVDTILARINHFKGTNDLPDDLTLVCIQSQAKATYQDAAAVGV